ncbi:MAG: AAA family ATPase [Sphingobium sp.]
MPRLIIISGCSGGGKSTLIDALRRSGEAVIEEPGRRVIAAERASGGNALPWTDLAGFLRKAIALSLSDLAEVRHLNGPVFLDRGLIDAAVALEYLTGLPMTETIGTARFHPLIFLAPPWPEIYGKDADRRHDMAEAVAEYERLEAAYHRLGYSVSILPRASVTERMAFIRDAIAGT